MNIEENPATLHTILAALRYYQECGGIDSVSDDLLQDIATNGDTVTPLTSDEIDTLCEYLNTGEINLS